jgi:predicted MarR family transcription regulator
MHNGTQGDPSDTSSDRATGITDIEMGVFKARRAFERWLVVSISKAGGGELASAEALIFLMIARSGSISAANIRIVLAFEHAHTVSHAVKKLHASGLIVAPDNASAKLLQASERGAEVFDSYLKLWTGYVAEAVNDALPADTAQPSKSGSLDCLSGLYAQATRAVAAL